MSTSLQRSTRWAACSASSRSPLPQPAITTCRAGSAPSARWSGLEWRALAPTVPDSPGTCPHRASWWSRSTGRTVRHVAATASPMSSTPSKPQEPPCRAGPPALRSQPRATSRRCARCWSPSAPLGRSGSRPSASSGTWSSWMPANDLAGDVGETAVVGDGGVAAGCPAGEGLAALGDDPFQHPVWVVHDEAGGFFQLVEGDDPGALHEVAVAKGLERRDQRLDQPADAPLDPGIGIAARYAVEPDGDRAQGVFRGV